ncbi:HK97-gp10 family putative phage morphogenesis protein [Providencia rettgeri]|uniref:HK97 gp10 family phage protein n=1 Tax=Providencia rettgeri TaxID=587 RepID=A0AAW6UKF0_PRORE|nr:HK97-gp10 family putative phage morphogenesis protein [Providencia rettgeri]MDI9093606.1 HK97 gp10 family phage protein [Providencia rettgeri]QPE15919.1 HK97 gp10 family phage protein [Providencia rettgeri]
MVDMSIDFSGFLDVSKELELLSQAESNKVLRQATYAAASVLRDEVRAKAPKRTGKLARNIVASNQRIRKKGEVSAGVYVRGTNKAGNNSDNSMKAKDPRNSYYWRFLEDGTAKMPPQPFIRPAFDSKADAAAEFAINKLNQAIDEALRK